MSDGSPLVVSMAELRSAAPPVGTSGHRTYIGSDEGARGTAVIIQDLFSNSGVQRNIATILVHYATRFRIRDCYVEGASGDSDFYTFESLPNDVRSLFCEWLLHQGYITGAELFCVEHPEIECDVFGVDAMGFYRTQSFVAALLQQSGRAAAKKAAAALSTFIAKLHDPADFALVARTVEALFQCLDWKLSEVRLDELVQIALNHSVPLDTIRDLPRVVGQYDLDQLYAWLSFAWAVEDSLAVHLDLLRIARLHQLLSIGARAFTLQLSSSMQPFITSVAGAKDEILNHARVIKKAWNLSEGWLRDVEAVAKDIALPSTFYYFAMLRSKAMADNSAALMKKHGLNICAMVTGGFHSTELARRLWGFHRIKSVIVNTSVSNLADGMFYGVRIVSEERGWSFSRALLSLLPQLVLEYGPVKVARKLIKLGLAIRRLKQVAKEAKANTSVYERQGALEEFLQIRRAGTALLVETGDLSIPFTEPHALRIISADQFVYHAGNLDMPGFRWTWRTGDYYRSSQAAVCCLRSYIPVASSSIDEVVWIPRSFMIREVERAKTATELLRILRDGSTLRIWLRPGGEDGRSTANKIQTAGGTIIGRSGSWLLARKGFTSGRVNPRCVEPVSEPLVCVLFLGGEAGSVENRIVTHLEQHNVTTLCQRSRISGLNSDLIDPGLALRRPSANEVWSLLRESIETAIRGATLTLLIASRKLLDLAGGAARLYDEVNANGHWMNRIFILAESQGDDIELRPQGYVCADINATLAQGGEIAQSVKDAVRARIVPGFAPSLPEFLLEYISCPECREHPLLSLQIGYSPPHLSDGILVCRQCKTAFHIRNGVPETIALAELRDSESVSVP